MFCIETESLRLRLEVAPVGCLLEHEKTLPHQAEKLILEFRNWTKLQNPIIVDENNIVLDGNHRTYVFKKLNFKYIPVCKIDYFHEATRLRYWFRLLGRIESVDLIKEIVEEMKGTFRKVTDKETLKAILECNALSCGIQKAQYFALIEFQEEMVNDAVSAYDLVERIQEKLLERGIELEYIPCQFAHERDFCDELSDDDLIIWTPQITKDMVIDAAKQKRPFAPKTTRHLIPARPLNVNVPTRWFKEDISLEEINKKFFDFLDKKELKRFGPGQVIDGRYYEEELFVFFDADQSTSSSV
jgi:hypothetical protein